jgi:hypothetical protein
VAEPLDLVGVTEIAAMLGGISTQRVNQLTHQFADFPEPVARPAAGRIWRRRDIERWIAKHPERPAGRPRRRGGSK